MLRPRHTCEQVLSSLGAHRAALTAYHRTKALREARPDAHTFAAVAAALRGEGFGELVAGLREEFEANGVDLGAEPTEQVAETKEEARLAHEQGRGGHSPPIFGVPPPEVQLAHGSWKTSLETCWPAYLSQGCGLGLYVPNWILSRLKA